MNDDLISRAAAIDILDAYQVMVENGEENPYAWARLRMSELPPAQPEVTEEAVKEYCRKRCLCIVDSALLKKYASAQPEEVIPVAWLEEQAKWFESMDNAFAKIEANNIRVMIKKWRSGDGRLNQPTGGIGLRDV